MATPETTPDVVFVSGESLLRRDYTPDGFDVPAGGVVVFGNTVGIAHGPILDGELGSLALGNGTYDAPTAEAIADGVWVYWDVTSSADGTVTATASEIFLGLSVSSTGSGGGTIRFLHLPPSPEA
jgi:predicted RecA/RadA family phage recombinase